MADILSTLRLDELMTETELTWQAALLFAGLIAIVFGVAGIVVAKAIKAFRDAFK